MLHRIGFQVPMINMIIQPALRWPGPARALARVIPSNLLMVTIYLAQAGAFGKKIDPR